MYFPHGGLRRYSPIVREQSSRNVHKCTVLCKAEKGLGAGGGEAASLLPPPPPCCTRYCTSVQFTNFDRELLVNIASRVIFKRIAVLNSDHGPVLGRLVRCLGFLVLYILWLPPSSLSPSSNRVSKNIISGLKGIVSWDWDWLEWIVNERSKELRIAGAYFYCFLMPFSCFNYQKASFVGFSFDSYSADDE